MPPWIPYRLEDVVDVDPARAAVRTYLEQKDLRAILALCSAAAPIQAAAEFGCGFGRLTQVLAEFAPAAYGLEREPHFVELGAQLIPAVHFMQTDDLARTPLEPASLDLAFTFTCLQHMIDRKAEQVLREMRRAVKPGGWLLLCEETDPSATVGDTANESAQCTVGRPVDWYRLRLHGCPLVWTQPRRIEPGYPRAHTGDYMLFRA